MIFFQIIFPIVLVIAVGFAADKLTSGTLDLKTLSRITMFILSPSLMFTSLLNTTITPADAGLMFVFSLALTAGVYLITTVIGRALRYSPADQNGLYLATIFPNAGNYGIPVALFAFGTMGMEREVLMLVYQNLLVSTLGVFFATSSHLDWRDAVKKVFQLPPFYAVLLAFIIRVVGVELSSTIVKPLELMGQASVPLLLLTLGIQLSRTRLEKHVGFIGVASSIRLIVSPLLGIAVAYLLGMSGLTAKTAVLAYSMPTAVTATLYAIEFNTSPSKVSAVTFVTTVLSTVTITLLLWTWLL